MTKKQDEEYKKIYESKKEEVNNYAERTNQEYNKKIKHWLVETNEQKTERTFRNIAITQYELRTKYIWTKQNGGAWGGHEPEMYQRYCNDHKKFKKQFMEVSFAYLNIHPTASWVPTEVYLHLLPELESTKEPIVTFDNIISKLL